MSAVSCQCEVECRQRDFYPKFKRFKITSALKHRLKNGEKYIFEAEDAENGSEIVILKTAKMWSQSSLKRRNRKKRKDPTEEDWKKNCGKMKRGAALLKFEAEMSERLQGSSGVPKFYFCGTDVQGKVLGFAMQKMGSDIYSLVKLYGGFSLATVLKLGIQMLERIEEVHRLGFVHRDIKSTNFVIGTGKNAAKIFLIDFEFCKAFLFYDDHNGNKSADSITTASNEELQSNQLDKAFVGTKNYMSLNVHKGFRATRRDDLESLAYVLLEMSLGKLPWENMQARGKILKEKEKFLSQAMELSFPGVDTEILWFFRAVRNLQSHQTPFYKEHIQLFKERLRALHVLTNSEAPDYSFEWMKNPEESMSSSEFKKISGNSVDFPHEKWNIDENAGKTSSTVSTISCGYCYSPEKGDEDLQVCQKKESRDNTEKWRKIKVKDLFLSPICAN